MTIGMSVALLAGAIFSIAWGASVLESLTSGGHHLSAGHRPTRPSGF